ncbi:hypothetical protein JXA47_03105 [Candidatus Sumerlaeota bacterium]|nr:hypothetical protein [Candidatus Sumerlaeota bacterium]
MQALRIAITLWATALLLPTARAQEGNSGSSPGGTTVHSSLVPDSRPPREEAASSNPRRSRQQQEAREAGEAEQAAAQEGEQRQVTEEEAAQQRARDAVMGRSGPANAAQPPTPPRTGRSRQPVHDMRSQADPNMPVLFFQPASVSVLEGEEFITTLELSNPAGRRFDCVSVRLQCNASAIEPIGQLDLPIYQSADDMRVAFDPAQGIVNCDIVFPEARVDQRARLLSLVWRARREIRSTEVLFDVSDEEPAQTFVGMLGGESILGSEQRESPGVISARVQVEPDLSALAIPDDVDGVAPWMVTGDSAEVPQGGMGLSLSPRAATSSRVLDVDVVISNPEGLQAEDVIFQLNFDPQTLTAIDTHSGNWIEMGINIWDGAYHQRFPFDVHVANQADNQRGEILYHMGFSEEMPLPQGIVATVRFRVLRLDAPMLLSFDPERTAIRHLGENHLGDPDDDSDNGLTGLLIDPPATPVASRSEEGPIS